MNFVLETETPDQTQPGSLSLSRSAGTGGREPWEQGWARTFLNNEGVSNFAEMADYNVEAKWTMAEWNSQNTLSLLYKGFQVAKINFWLYENATHEKSAKE